MTIDRQALEALDRQGLLAEAHRQGVKRAEVMTRVELTDEILRLGTPNPIERKEARGWLGVARDLVASIVDKGLNLPDAAAVIRGDARFEPLKRPHAPVATVTLAEIYGAQGHYARAMAMLDEVLEKEPDHHVARRLRERLELVAAHRGVSPVPAAPPVEAEPEMDAEPSDAEGDPDGTALTLPPPLQPHVNGSAGGPPEDTDGTFPTLPPLENAVASSPPPSSDADGTLSTLPPREGPAEDADEDDALKTLPVADAFEEEAPKTLAPEQVPVAQEPPPFTPSIPVRRVAPSDVDWEPLPQTELAPKIVEAPSETDAVIVLRTGETTASLYFELGSAPSSAAVLRVVELRPRRTFAERVERELPVTAKGGIVTVEDLERGSIVRAAIGVREGDLFRALAVAAEVRASASGPEVVWAPRKEADYGAVARNAALVLPQLRV